MLKYEGRISSFCGGVETNVKCEGSPLTGKRLFRNELAQRYFDKLRNQLDLDDYGRLSEDNNTFFFRFFERRNKVLHPKTDIGTCKARRRRRILIRNVMYEITDVIREYLFVTLRLRDVQTGVTREWKYWDDLEEWLCKEHGVKDLKGLIIDKLPDYGDWVEAGK